MKKTRVLISLIFFAFFASNINAQTVVLSDVIPTTSCDSTGAILLIVEVPYEINSVTLGTKTYTVTVNDTVWVTGLYSRSYNEMNYVHLTSGGNIYFEEFYVPEEGPILSNQMFSPTTCGANGWVLGEGHNASYAKLYNSNYSLISTSVIDGNTWRFDTIVPGTYRVVVEDSYGCTDDGPEFTIGQGNAKIYNLDVSNKACGAEGIIAGDMENIALMYLTLADTSLVDSCYADSTGSFYFDSLMPTNYMLYGVALAGCENTSKFVSIEEKKREPEYIDMTNVPFCDMPVAKIDFGYGVDIVDVYGYSDVELHCGDATISGLSAGNQTITVELENNCFSEFVVVIVQDPAPQISIVDIMEPTCSEASDGYLIFDLIGKTDSVFFVGEKIEGFQLDSLSSGSDSLVVFDRGCSVKKTFVIPETDEECFHVYLSFTPNGDGYNDFFEIKAAGTTEIPIVVYSKQGTIVYQNSDYHNDWDGIDEKTGELVPTGNYFVSVTASFANGKNIEKKSGLSIKY